MNCRRTEKETPMNSKNVDVILPINHELINLNMMSYSLHISQDFALAKLCPI